MLDTVDGSGSGGLFVDENQASCGSIVPTGNLHLSPLGAVLQKAREPKPAAGERPAIPGARSPKIWDATEKRAQPTMGVRCEGGQSGDKEGETGGASGDQQYGFIMKAPVTHAQAFTIVFRRAKSRQVVLFSIFSAWLSSRVSAGMEETRVVAGRVLRCPSEEILGKWISIRVRLTFGRLAARQGRVMNVWRNRKQNSSSWP